MRLLRLGGTNGAGGTTGRVLAIAASMLATASLVTGTGLGNAPEARAAPATGFQDTEVLTGLVDPTAVRFSPDGKVFVAQKSGVVKVFDSLTDPTPTVFANLKTKVFNSWDRGLLGLEVDPAFPAKPYVYVSYTHDAVIGGTAPRWGQPGAVSDTCPNPPGATDRGCVVSGRISRLTASGDQMTGSEKVLVEDFCQQYPSHSMGDLRFGPDGNLFASSGDGASWNFTDYGQIGNPCGDPPGEAGTDLTAPRARGGALRSQAARRPSGDPVSLDGSVLRINPATGKAVSTNPLASSKDPKERRIYAFGLRNPFRMTVRPGTSEVWLGDVGWRTREEIDRLPVPSASKAANLGWPCYEGRLRQPAYDAVNLNQCESLYTRPRAHTAPYFAYRHDRTLSGQDTCPSGSASTSGLAFYDRAGKGGDYPAGYTGALFFADHSRDCIWVMHRGSNGLPDPGTVQTFVSAAANPVALEIGPGGDLFYVDFEGGAVHRVRYLGSNHPPVPDIVASPSSGEAPLDVTFDGRGSSDPDPGSKLAFAWDLDGDGAFDDGSSPTASFTYTTPGTKAARLRVTDEEGAAATASTTVQVSNTAPVPEISSPTSATTWSANETLAFSGSATDAQDGTLPASRLTWQLVMHHCPSDCHEHVVESFTGVSQGTFTAPDHEYPSYLELRLTAKDSTGTSATTSVNLQPRTVTLELRTSPTGLKVSSAYGTQASPQLLTVIAGSSNTITAVSPQTVGQTSYEFVSWSDGGAATHQVTAPASGTATYTATFRVIP